MGHLLKAFQPEHAYAPHQVSQLLEAELLRRYGENGSPGLTYEQAAYRLVMILRPGSEEFLPEIAEGVLCGE